MEINKQSDVLGVVPTEDITEGRMVLLTSHPGHGDDLTGRPTDIPGVKLPETEAEANRARYVLTWKVDRREPPIVNWPSYNYALRQTFDRDTNAPITGKTIYLTYPGYQESVTIPSGTNSLALGGGTYTIPSGQFVYSGAMQVPGTRLSVANTGDDGAASAGMLKVQEGNEEYVAVVERFDTSAFSLTFRTERP